MNIQLGFPPVGYPDFHPCSSSGFYQFRANESHQRMFGARLETKYAMRIDRLADTIEV
jgi:hypothetical protein